MDGQERTNSQHVLGPAALDDMLRGVAWVDPAPSLETEELCVKESEEAPAQDKCCGTGV